MNRSHLGNGARHASLDLLKIVMGAILGLLIGGFAGGAVGAILGFGFAAMLAGPISPGFLNAAVIVVLTGPLGFGIGALTGGIGMARLMRRFAPRIRVRSLVLLDLVLVGAIAAGLWPLSPTRVG